jgi:hypothetical protein
MGPEAGIAVTSADAPTDASADTQANDTRRST